MKYEFSDSMRINVPSRNLRPILSGNFQKKIKKMYDVRSEGYRLHTSSRSEVSNIWKYIFMMNLQ
jgi:hypothetical protein